MVARGIEDVLLVSELHAAAALAQAVGRAVGYDKTALMFVERDTATLAVVETADGSVVKVLSRSLHGEDAIAVLAEMVTRLEVQESAAQGLFVVGSGVDVTAVKAQLTDLVSVPVIAPEEPQLALARGAALASANAPRYDTSTVGLAYSQDPDDTVRPVAYPMALAGDATTFLGHDDSSPDTADIASGPRRRAETQQALPVDGQLGDRHLRSGSDGTDHRDGHIRRSSPRRDRVAFERCDAASGRADPSPRPRPPRRSWRPRRSQDPPRRRQRARGPRLHGKSFRPPRRQ